VNSLGSLLIIKLILSVLIIVGVAEISKRISPLIGGIISGLPLGTGLSIYFISYEQGIDFTTEGVPWGIAGLSASIIFCLVYLLVARKIRLNNRLLVIGYSSSVSLVSFLIIGYILYLFNLTLIRATAIFIIVFCLNLLVINKLIGTQDTPKKSSSTMMQIICRGIIVGAILILITGVASVAGSKWAGILSSFPSTLFPLLIVLHYEEGNKLFPYVIYGFSYSISTLLLFYISFIYIVPLFGLNIGFLLIYILCSVYLISLRKIQN